MEDGGVNPSTGAEVANHGETRQFPGLRHWVRTGSVAGCALGDGLAIIAAALLAALARFGSVEEGNTGDLLLVVLPSYFLAAVVFSSYRLSDLTKPFRSVVRALSPLAVALVLTSIAAYAFKVGAKYSRLESGYFVVFATLTLLVWRSLLAFWLSRFRSLIRPNVVLLTDDPSGLSLDGAVSVVDLRSYLKFPEPDDPQFLDQLFKQLHSFDRVVLSIRKPTLRNIWVDVMRRTGLEAEVLEPQFSGIRPLGLRWLAGAPTLVISRGPLNLGERGSKRLLDLAVMFVLAPLLFPLLCLVAAAIKLDSRGPILFVQRRVGQNNRQFNCYKFRTMRSENEDPNGSRSASRDDDRLTRVGSLLRRTSLDELPQLWNVLKGEMSFVGPRPHALGSTVEGRLFWKAAQGYWLRHAVKPGMTGLAQVRGFRGSTRSQEELEQRVASDLEYINNWSVWLDIQILITTSTVLVHEKAY